MSLLPYSSNVPASAILAYGTASNEPTSAILANNNLTTVVREQLKLGIAQPMVLHLGH